MISLKVKIIIKKWISVTLIMLVILVAVNPNTWKTIYEEKKIFAETTLKNPRIEKDDSMDAEQKVTWDCVYFGSYPQTEIVDKAETSGVYGKKWTQKDDYEIDKKTYAKLENAVDWDENGDITIEGKKYRRVSIEDTTFHEKNSTYYEWENSGNINQNHRQTTGLAGGFDLRDECINGQEYAINRPNEKEQK